MPIIKVPGASFGGLSGVRTTVGRSKTKGVLKFKEPSRFYMLE